MKDLWKDCLAAYRAGKTKEAVKLAKKHIAKHPYETGSLQILSLCHLRLDDPDEAIRVIDKALVIDPNCAASYCQKGTLLQRVKRFGEAERAFLAAIRIDPNFVLPHHQLAYVDLAVGRYAEGWQNFELRMDLMPEAFPHIKSLGADRLWKKGEDLHDFDHIVVITEQGQGDALQFSRYMKSLRENFDGKLTFCCYNSVASLLKNSGVEADFWVRFNPGGQLILPDGFDRYCFSMSLPHLLDLPYPQSVLPLVPSRTVQFDDPSDFNVIVCHVGNPLHDNDAWRSCALSHLGRIAALPGVKLHTLQPSQRLNEGCDFQVTDLSPQVANFECSAAFVKAADLVISVDTSVLHLAGGVGTETWAALPFYGEWRWGTDPDQTAWYPSVQLFRQDRPGNWEGVFRRMERLLRVKLSSCI